MKVLNKILRNLFFGKNLLIILGVIKILIIFDKIVLSKIKGSVLIIMEMKMVNY